MCAAHRQGDDGDACLFVYSCVFSRIFACLLSVSCLPSTRRRFARNWINRCCLQERSTYTFRYSGERTGSIVAVFCPRLRGRQTGFRIFLAVFGSSSCHRKQNPSCWAVMNENGSKTFCYRVPGAATIVSPHQRWYSTLGKMHDNLQNVPVDELHNATRSNRAESSASA